MKKDKGITMVALVITIIVLIILSGISVGTANKIIKSSELENLKTNMLLIKVKGKEYIENANFKLGTNIESSSDKESKVTAAKEELKGEEITSSNIFDGNTNITQDTITNDNANYIYYYKLSTEDLKDMGISNVKSDEKKGCYIIKYDIKNMEIEVYNTIGFENEGKVYYSSTEIQNLNI